ncbi:MAG: hypothetical protein IT158_25780 [Bryobacterales bacterium]|nr:hypothetical protein [Bryobacterales bacterium]
MTGRLIHVGKHDKSRASWITDFCLILALSTALIWPLFRTTYLDNWASIDSTFIADARFLNRHWPHPRWQPLWYCGTRFDYIYPPALRYGTALIARTAGVPEARAYHIYTAFFYCLGIAGVYVLVRVLSGSRGIAWLGAAAAALLSPSFLLLPDIRRDAGNWLIPQRLHVLLRYGEGPHMTAFSLLPLALAASFRALQKYRPAVLALAAALCALVVSNNFYGATALAILFPWMAWSVRVTRLDRWVWLRAACIAVLAYGLTAFWLVPSYLRITLRNMEFVATPGNAWSGLVVAVCLAGFGLLSWKFARGRPERDSGVFVWGAAAILLLVVAGWYWLKLRVIGEPIRLVPELDLVLTLAALEGLRRLWQRRVPALRLAAILVVLLAFATARRYVRHSWEIYREDPNYRQRVEFRIPGWMSRNLPGMRTVAAGSVRFWYNAWFDLPQLGGGSEQGLLNTAVMPAQWEILIGPEPELGILWMQAMGADTAIVHDKQSQEIYHDWTYPRKFTGALPAVYDDGQGNVIYRAPRRFPGLARVVDTARHDRLLPPRGSTDAERVQPYAESLERGPDSPATAVWNGTDAMRVQAQLEPGQSLVVLVSYDSAWRATSAGLVLPVRQDAFGFLRIDAPPGRHDIDLRFTLPLENLAGWLITVWAILAAAGLLFQAWRQRSRGATLYG